MRAGKAVHRLVQSALRSPERSGAGMERSRGGVSLTLPVSVTGLSTSVRLDVNSGAGA